MPAAAPPRSHRRSTKVCTRCRLRKTKCDFKYPACSTCKLANASCLGFDPTTRQPVPRSLVKSLEARVAELEACLLPFRAAPQNLPYSMSSRIAQATISFGLPSSGSYLHSNISSTLLFRPSCPPLAVVRARASNASERRGSSPGETSANPRTKLSTANMIDFATVPLSAVMRMINNYVDTHLPQYPCIPKSLLESIVQRTQNEDIGDLDSLSTYGIPSTSSLGHFEYFVLFIVLAISAMTLTWRDEDQARAASESFYKSAIKHLHVLEDHSEIKALRISLLLAHYAHMCPERLDNWTCISNAVRIVLNLGLYQECPDSLDVEEAQLRSELFWVTYGMERSMCSNLRLPLSFPEEVITTKLEGPPSSDLDSLSPSDNTRKLSPATQIYRYRALETEVHRVLHLEDDVHNFGSSMIENWIQDIDGRLEVWYKEAQSYAPFSMLEFRHVQFHHLKARVHRPTPRLRNRTTEDRRIVLEASLVLIEDYLGQERRGRLFYPWHGVHILFEVVVISLEACWSSRDNQVLKDLAVKILGSSIPQCLQLLTKIGQRWNEASVCADTLRPLVQKITSALAQEGDYLLFDDASISEEIQGLLFSDGPLTWNSTLPEDDIFGSGNVLSFLDNMVVDEVEFFQWAPEWDFTLAEIAQDGLGSAGST